MADVDLDRVTPWEPRKCKHCGGPNKDPDPSHDYCCVAHFMAAAKEEWEEELQEKCDRKAERKAEREYGAKLEALGVQVGELQDQLHNQDEERALVRGIVKGKDDLLRELREILDRLGAESEERYRKWTARRNGTEPEPRQQPTNAAGEPVPF